jgi:hypothetical protein
MTWPELSETKISRWLIWTASDSILDDIVGVASRIYEMLRLFEGDCNLVVPFNYEVVHTIMGQVYVEDGKEKAGFM